MILTDEQKDLIFYVLEGFMNSLYWDEDEDELTYYPHDMYFNMHELCKIKSSKVSLREFTRFIEKTMDLMCK